jgi:hypothetical protein
VSYCKKGRRERRMRNVRNARKKKSINDNRNNTIVLFMLSGIGDEKQ